MTQPHLAFTQKYSGLTNRIITPVQIAAAFDPNNPPPNPKFIMVAALWDTGATQSVVSAITAKTLGLVEVGKSLVHHAGGKGMASTYVVNFILPNQVGMPGVLVSECPDPEGGQFGAIIGMDIIMAGDFSISNFNGISRVTYRYPSIGVADFVADIQKQRQESVPRVGRNDPCSCGSGKKYKKCHGA